MKESYILTTVQQTQKLEETETLSLSTCKSKNMSLSQVKVAQSCPALCKPMDYTVGGILQARILEWVAVPFSRGSSQPRDQSHAESLQHIAGIFFTS